MPGMDKIADRAGQSTLILWESSKPILFSAPKADDIHRKIAYF